MDLCILDVDVSTVDEVLALLQDETPEALLTPKLAEVVRRLEVQFPGEELSDFDESPWSSWPLTQPVAEGRGCVLSIRWSRAEDMTILLHNLCVEAGLAFYDMQNETLVRPTRPIEPIEPIEDDEPPRRGFLGRWRSRPSD